MSPEEHVTLSIMEALVRRIEALQEQVAKLTERVDELDEHAKTFVVRDEDGYIIGDGAVRYSRDQAEMMVSRGVNVVEVLADTLDEVGE